MPRPEKVEAVAEIKERIERAQAVFLAEYAGLSVKAQQELRRGLRAQGAEFKVVKMTLARRAASELELEELDGLLIGPTGVTFADKDPVSTAKALKEFAKTHDVFTLKGGLLGRDVLTPERIGELAEIAPRETLLAQLAGAMLAPMANLAGVLSALPRNAASGLQQLLEKKQAEAGPTEAASTAVAGEAPADETAAEAPTEEATAVETNADEAPAEEAVADEAPTEDEAVADEAVADEPVADEPVADEPVAVEPVADEPSVADEAVADEPVVDEAVADEPAAGEPVVDAPVVDEPAADDEAVTEKKADETQVSDDDDTAAAAEEE